jgi:hypothetical protein
MKLSFKIKHKKRFWWTIGTLFLLFILFLTGAIRIYIPYNYSYWVEINESYSKKVCDDGRERLYDVKNERFVTKKMDWIAKPRQTDSLTVFSDKKRRGYLNVHTGKVQLKPAYLHAWQFSEGLAAVDVDGWIGFIDAQGKTRIPFRFKAPSRFRNCADLQFKQGYCVMQDTAGKYGLIDRNGAWVLAPQFDFIFSPVKGLRVVQRDSSYGLLNNQLKLVLPCDYEVIAVVNGGLKVVKDGVQQILSYDARTVVEPFVYDYCNLLQYDTGLLNEDGTSVYKNSACLSYTVNNLMGLMGRDGRVITKAIFGEIHAISENLFCCEREHYSITLTADGQNIQTHKSCY